jgi:hypothetical protein
MLVSLFPGFESQSSVDVRKSPILKSSNHTRKGNLKIYVILNGCRKDVNLARGKYAILE